MSCSSPGWGTTVSNKGYLFKPRLFLEFNRREMADKLEVQTVNYQEYYFYDILIWYI